jgi:hypothetical protein
MKKGKYRGKNISNYILGGKGGGTVAGENGIKNGPIENGPIHWYPGQGVINALRLKKWDWLLIWHGNGLV